MKTFSVELLAMLFVIHACVDLLKAARKETQLSLHMYHPVKVKTFIPRELFVSFSLVVGHA